jgi:hypothetical protein
MVASEDGVDHFEDGAAFVVAWHDSRSIAEKESMRSTNPVADARRAR